MEPFNPVEINPANILTGQGTIPISAKTIYKEGKHFEKHGRKMGYNSIAEYDAAAHEFAQRYQNHPDAIIKEGELNIGNPNLPRPKQRIIEYGDLAVIIEDDGKIINFYEGNEHRALINIRRIK